MSLSYKLFLADSAFTRRCVALGLAAPKGVEPVRSDAYIRRRAQRTRGRRMARIAADPKPLDSIDTSEL